MYGEEENKREREEKKWQMTCETCIKILQRVDHNGSFFRMFLAHMEIFITGRIYTKYSVVYCQNSSAACWCILCSAGVSTFVVVNVICLFVVNGVLLASLCPSEYCK
jgi:hypothetical protein